MRIRELAHRQIHGPMRTLRERGAFREDGGMTDRSNRREVRNPALKLPAVRLFNDLPPEARLALRAALLELRTQSQAEGEKLWKKHKGPMAAYHKAVGTYAGHFARAISRNLLGVHHND
jgi:hypothetical protein